jgi:FkbM family methyltransferase
VRRAQLIGRLSRSLRRNDAATIVALEAKVEQLRTKVERLRDRRVAQQWSAAYVDSPLMRLDYDGAEIKVVAAARHRTARAQTKEPFTVEWIERTFGEGDVLYDVGANVGAYTLIAATIAPDARIVAFEPGCVTFAVLCSNLAVNGLGGRVIPLPVTLGSKSAVASLRYWSLAPGAGVLDTTNPTAADDPPIFEQPVLVQRLDDLVRSFDLPLPTHVKLDVDGAESAVLHGATETLAASSLRTLMVELASDAEAALVQQLGRHGFEVVERHAPREETGMRYATFARSKGPANRPPVRAVAAAR